MNVTFEFWVGVVLGAIGALALLGFVAFFIHDDNDHGPTSPPEGGLTE